MIRKIALLMIGFSLLFSACDKKNSIESLYRDAEKMEPEILKSVDVIARYRANYEKILREAPESEFAPQACFKLAKLNEIFGHSEDAIDYYRKLLVQYPGHPLCADGLFNLASLYQLHTGTDEAITAYTQLVNFYPDKKVAFQGLVQLGQLLSEKEKWQDAVYYFQTIVDKYPDQPICDGLCFRMGDILQNKVQDRAKAVAMYQKVIEKYPGSSWVQFAQERLKTLNQGEQKNENE
jgi:TolA-binding protein